jgi:restriction endonuclease S subunit
MTTDIYSTKLSDVADILPGHPFRGTIKMYDNGNVNVVQVRNTEITGEIKQEGIIKTILSTKKQPCWLEKGDILFVAKGAQHYSVLVGYILEPTVCSPHFFLVRMKPEFKDRLSPEFLCWQLNQQLAQRHFKSKAEGSNYLSIRRQILEEAPVKIIPFEKQNKIAALHMTAVKEQKILMQLIENRKTQLEAIAFQELENF